MSDDKQHFDAPSVRSKRAVLSTISRQRSAAPASLPLFEWRPARQVLLFPLTKRIGKVRHTAKLLSGKHGEEAELYWKQVVSANRKHLARFGLDDNEIDVQLRAFFEAVQGELNRIDYEGASSGQRPGGGSA